MEQYEGYELQDRSFSERWLGRLFWDPIARRLPRRLHPNYITVAGFVSALTGLVFVWLALHGHRVGYLGAGASVLGWFAADNVDGRHARRTGQTSALGEFLDHWFDLFTSLIVTFTAVMFLRLDGVWLFVLAGVIAAGYFASMWEQRHSGVFHIEEVGANEAMLVLMSLYVVLFFLPDSRWLVWGQQAFNVATVVLAIVLLAGTWTLIAAIRRCRGPVREFLPLVLAAITMSVLGIRGVWTEPTAAAGILVMHGLLAGPLILTRLSGEEAKWRGPIISAAAAVALLGLILWPDASAVFWARQTVMWSLATVVALILAWDISQAARTLVADKAAVDVVQSH